LRDHAGMGISTQNKQIITIGVIILSTFLLTKVVASSFELADSDTIPDAKNYINKL
jgi:hypothetical protein